MSEIADIPEFTIRQTAFAKKVGQRLDRAEALGWQFKNNRVTPGLSRLAVIRPDGTTVDGLLFPFFAPFMRDIARQLDMMGVPE